MLGLTQKIGVIGGKPVKKVNYFRPGRITENHIKKITVVLEAAGVKLITQPSLDKNPLLCKIYTIVILDIIDEPVKFVIVY